MKFLKEESVHEFKLNDFYRYGLAMIGYKDGVAYTYFEDKLNFDSVYSTSGDSVRLKSVKLSKQSEKAFFKRVRKFTNGKGLKHDVKKDLMFEAFFESDKKRKQKVQDMVNFRREMQEYVFPLYYLDVLDYHVSIRRIKERRDAIEAAWESSSLVFVKADYSRAYLRKRNMREVSELTSRTIGLLGNRGDACVLSKGRGEYFNAYFSKEGRSGEVRFGFETEESKGEDLKLILKKENGYWVGNSPYEEEVVLYFIESDFELGVKEVNKAVGLPEEK